MTYRLSRRSSLEGSSSLQFHSNFWKLGGNSRTLFIQSRSKLALSWKNSLFFLMKFTFQWGNLFWGLRACEGRSSKISGFVVPRLRLCPNDPRKFLNSWGRIEVVVDSSNGYVAPNSIAQSGWGNFSFLGTMSKNSCHTLSRASTYFGSGRASRGVTSKKDRSGTSLCFLPRRSRLEKPSRPPR